MKLLSIIVIFALCCSCIDANRHGFIIDEEVVINNKYRGFVRGTPTFINDGRIAVEWIDEFGQHNYEYIDVRYLSKLKTN